MQNLKPGDMIKVRVGVPSMYCFKAEADVKVLQLNSYEEGVHCLGEFKNRFGQTVLCDIEPNGKVVGNVFVPEAVPYKAWRTRTVEFLSKTRNECIVSLGFMEEPEPVEPPPEPSDIDDQNAEAIRRAEELIGNRLPMGFIPPGSLPRFTGIQNVGDEE